MSSRPFLSHSLRCAFSLVALLALPFPVHAIDYNWQGASGTQAWSLNTNWNPNTSAGVLNSTTNQDKAIFNTPTAATITIDAGRNIKDITFDTAAGSFILGSNAGEALHLSSGGFLKMLGFPTVPASTSPGSLKTQTINSPLILEPLSNSTSGTYTFSNDANNRLTGTNSDPADAAAAAKLNLTGKISGGATSSTITLILAGSVGTRSANNSPAGFTNLISGIIEDGNATGGLALTVDGSNPKNNLYNAWNLTGVNTYSGATTVNIGALYFNSLADSGTASALGKGTSIVLGNGNAHLIYYGGATSTNRTITSNGGSFYSLGTGAITLTGGVNTTGGINFRGSNHFIVNSVISGAGGVNRTDTGTVFLNQINTFTGNLSISDGTFSFATINNGGTAEITNSAIGKGTIISLGQNSGTAGRIQFTGSTGGSSNREIRLSNGNAASSGNGRIENTVAGQKLTLTGLVRATDTNATFSSSLELLGNGDGEMGGIIGGIVGASATPTNTKITKTGTGTWALSRENIYFGGTTISGGTLLITNPNPTTGSGTGSGSVTVTTSATLGGTGSITGGSSASITLSTGTFLMVGNTHNIANGLTGPTGYTSGVSDLHLGSATNVIISLAGTLQFDLFGNDIAAITSSEADLLKIASNNANIGLGGIISVADVSGAAAGSWTAGTWQLIDWTGFSGIKSGNFTFALPTTSLASGYTWDTTAFLTNGTISIVAAVPEPSRLFLLGLSTAAFFLHRKRR